MFDNLKIESSAPLIDALKKMDQISRKLLLVFERGKFTGLISIGDIQRALINNVDLQTKISHVLRKDLILASTNDSKYDIKKKMMSIRTEYMPVIDENNEIQSIIFWEDLFEEQKPKPARQFNLPVIIMAGGLGTRMRPLTNVLPKPLLPINEKTIIEHIFDRFYEYGCSSYHISVNYKAELIEFYLGNLHLPYSISYFQENKPMGTAGSLSLLKGKINQTFFVSNCDILIEQDYSEILDYHEQNNNEITVVVALKTYSIPYGTIESGENGELIKLDEKPDMTFKINSGMYILEPHLIDEVPDNEFFHITDLIEKIKQRNGKVGVFPVSEKSWKDIGEWDEYLKNIK